MVPQMAVRLIQASLIENILMVIVNHLLTKNFTNVCSTIKCPL